MRPCVCTMTLYQGIRRKMASNILRIASFCFLPKTDYVNQLFTARNTLFTNVQNKLVDTFLYMLASPDSHWDHK